MVATTRFMQVVAGIVLALMAVNAAAGVEGNAKRGRVYFKMVCTVCHIQQAGRALPPNAHTMAEWRAYLDADQHDTTGETNPSVKYFVSREFRESIQDTNKAAKKFLDLSDEQLWADVEAILITGAKDSDTPVSCQ